MFFIISKLLFFPRVLQKVEGIQKDNVYWGDAYGDLGTIYLGEVQHHQPGFCWTNSLTNQYSTKLVEKIVIDTDLNIIHPNSLYM